MSISVIKNVFISLQRPTIAIISFLAAFFLIRYKLKVAKNEENEADGKRIIGTKPHMNEKSGSQRLPTPNISSGQSSNRLLSSVDLESAQVVDETGFDLHTPESENETDPMPGPILMSRSLSDHSSPPRNQRRHIQPIWSTNPHLVQVGPFQSQPPTHLLSRCHGLCILLSALGFILGLVGILAFAWDQLPLSSSISASFFMAFCLLASISVICYPDPGEGRLSPRIYFLGET